MSSKIARDPGEFIKVPGKDKFFIVTDRLCTDPEVPGGDSRGSLFEFDIILYEQGAKRSKFVTANLKSGFSSINDHPDELVALSAQYKKLIDHRQLVKLKKALQASTATETVDTSCADYTFTMGKLKGVTIRDALIGGRKAEVVSTAQFMRDNLSKYPRNQDAIDKIEASIKLFDAGKLTAAVSGNTPIKMTLLSTDIKSKKGKVNIKGLEGTTKYYQLTIRYDSEMKKPFIFEITNSWGTTKLNGKLVSLDKVVYQQKESFLCTEELFRSILMSLKAAWDAFMQAKHTAKNDGAASYRSDLRTKYSGSAASGDFDFEEDDDADVTVNSTDTDDDDDDDMSLFG